MKIAFALSAVDWFIATENAHGTKEQSVFICHCEYEATWQFVKNIK
jgi:hypothetical protein